MNLTNKLITDTFKCPTFEINNLSPISFKLCLDRQIIRNVQANCMLYPECSECETGKEIKEHFKDYKGKAKFKNPAKNPAPIPIIHPWRKPIRKGKAKVEDNPISLEKSPCFNCQQLIDLKIMFKAQAEYAIDLAMEGRLNEALKRMRLIEGL